MQAREIHSSVTGRTPGQGTGFENANALHMQRSERDGDCKNRREYEVEGRSIGKPEIL